MSEGKTRSAEELCTTSAAAIRELQKFTVTTAAHNALQEESDGRMKAIRALEAQVKEYSALLAVAKCPACDGAGSIPHQIGDNEWEAEQCQWCFESKAMG